MFVFAGNAAYEVSPGIVGLANNLTQKKRNNKLSSGFSRPAANNYWHGGVSAIL